MHDKKITTHLSQNNPYVCLNLLESALVCSKRKSGNAIPEKMTEDLNTIFGADQIKNEIEYLEEIDILKNEHGEISIKSIKCDMVHNLLNEMKQTMVLSYPEVTITAGEFLEKLKKYLIDNVENLNVISEKTNRLVINYDDDIYYIDIAVSPVWLPAAAEMVAQDQDFYGVIGPFSAQSWETMYPYYDHPDFRDYTAYFDPWNFQKMNISKGNLFIYFDRFLRDVFRKKFIIPETFKEALNDMGLLKFNDEW